MRMMTNGESVARHWLIDGRVQGVGYRMWLQAEAGSVGVEGWVRNLSDGRVEALVRGAAPVLDQLATAACRGPRLAAVGQVVVRPWSGAVPAGPFKQIATAPHPEPD
jgi:acylphosphatase